MYGMRGDSHRNATAVRDWESSVAAATSSAGLVPSVLPESRAAPLVWAGLSHARAQAALKPHMHSAGSNDDTEVGGSPPSNPAVAFLHAVHAVELWSAELAAATTPHDVRECLSLARTPTLAAAGLTPTLAEAYVKQLPDERRRLWPLRAGAPKPDMLTPLNEHGRGDGEGHGLQALWDAFCAALPLGHDDGDPSASLVLRDAEFAGIPITELAALFRFAHGGAQGVYLLFAGSVLLYGAIDVGLNLYRDQPYGDLSHSCTCVLTNSFFGVLQGTGLHVALAVPCSYRTLLFPRCRHVCECLPGLASAAFVFWHESGPLQLQRWPRRSMG